MPMTKLDTDSIEPHDTSGEVEAISEDKRTGKFSPFSGCLIAIILTMVVAGVVSYSIYSYKQVQETFAGLAEGTPQEVSLFEAEGNEALINTLTDKLKTFQSAMNAQSETQLELSADDLNLAIASYAILEPHRGKIFVESISEEFIEAEVSYPIKTELFSDQLQYLNAKINIVPEIKDGSFYPFVTSVDTASGNEVLAEIKKFFSESMLHPLRNDEEIGPLFEQISGIELADGKITLLADPSYESAEALPDDINPMIQRFMKGFAIIAIIFLLIVAVIIILSRRKANQTL